MPPHFAANTVTFSQQQLQGLIADLAEGIILLDPTGRILWANPAALQMHGCAQTEELGDDAADYTARFVLSNPHRQQCEAEAPLQERLAACQECRDLSIEISVRGHMPAERLLKVTSRVLVDSQQRPESQVLILNDITRRVDAESRFDQAFSVTTAPAAILRLSDAHFVEANSGFLTLTGFSQNEVVGRPLHDINVLHGAEHRSAAIRALNAHQPIPAQELRLPTQDGDDKQVTMTGQPIDVEGERCMLFSFQDMEAKHKAETARRESDNGFSTLFQLAPVPMLLCRGEPWQVINHNPAFTSTLGYPDEDLHQQPISKAGLVDSKQVQSNLGATLKEGKSVHAQPVRWVTADKQPLDGLLSAASVVANGVDCILLTFRDTTKRQQSEADMMTAIDTVMEDASWFSRTLVDKLAQVQQPEHGDNGLDCLTKREREILTHICQGQTDEEIAEALCLSRHTVRNHVANLFDKTEVDHRSAVVVWGRERGLGIAPC